MTSKESLVMDLEETSPFFQGLTYALCTLCGVSVLLSIMIAVISVSHKQMRKDKSLTYVRYSKLLMALANIGSGVGVVLVILWPGSGSRAFCETGGFLVLFGYLESTWMLLVCCTTLLIHMKATVKSRGLALRGPMIRSGHKWSFPIFLLTMLLKAVVLAMLVFLSLTKKEFFKNSDSSCQLISLIGEEAWQYTATLVVLGWVAVLAATILSLLNLFVYGPRILDLCHARYTTGLRYSSREKFSHRMAIVYLVMALLWIVVLMTTTVIVFSGEDIITEDYVNLALGYSFTLATCFSMAAMVVILIVNRRWRQRGVTSGSGDKDVLLKGAPPNALASVIKLAQQKDDVRRYQVQWLDKRGQVTSGVMKTFHPGCLAKWRCEVSAIAKLSVASHPNVAEYLWESHKNRFAADVSSFTGDLISPECSVTCMTYYPHGTLGSYLKTRSHMTEVGLHQVTLDIARGLGFIHQNHLVHNGLTTETVYMASVSGKIGLRSVIGDFENSYEVSENTLRKSPLTFDRPYVLDTCSFGSLYSISQQMDLDNNKFAPDIRSFGMIVLEMLIALGEFDEHSGMGIHYRSKDVRRSSLYDNTSLVSSQSQPVDRKRVVSAGSQLDIMGSDSHLNRLNQARSHHQHGSDKSKCKCSPRVTDIRALRPGSADSSLFLYKSDGEQPKTADSLLGSSCQKGSAFSSTNSQENINRDTGRCARDNRLSLQVRDLPMSVSRKRAIAIQNRDLPPVPPKSQTSTSSKSSTSSSKRQHKYSRPTCDIIRPVVADGVLMSPPRTDNSGQNLNSSSDVESYDFSPSSDEFYSLSVGSLGSFETIYEDEEKTVASNKGSPHYQNTNSIKSGHKTVTGKPPVFKRKAQDEAAQRKRFSISSANESVFSSDSGVGSYLSDTYSDTYTHRLWKDMHRGRKELESPDTTYHPRPGKHPFSKRHPGSGHICTSDPGFSSNGPCDSSASNTDTLSSDEPTYESIGGRSSIDSSRLKLGHATPPLMQARKRTALMTRSSDSLKIPMKDLISGVQHPVIKQQYRFAVPRLGISAVLARRPSDVSLSSVNSQRSTDLPQSARDAKASSVNLSGSSSNVSSDPRGRSPGGEAGTQPKGDVRNTSLSSSVPSVVQDSNIHADDTTVGKQSKSTDKTSSSHGRFTKASRSSSRTSLSKPPQVSQYGELAKFSNFLDCVSLEPKEKTRMLSMLKLISRNDRLGFIGQQLMSLFSDCWLEDPVPSADEILQRLNLVLPSASV